MSILKKTTIGILSAAVVLSVSAGAFAHEKKGGGRDGRGQMPTFEEVDTSGDGKLDITEFSAPLLKRFDEVDADSNGTVTKEELEKFASTSGERRVKRVTRQFGDEMTKEKLQELHAEKFAKLDADDDGFLAQDELKRFGKRGGGKRGGKNKE